LRSARVAASDALLADLASLRLARVQYALGEADAALQSLQSIRNEGYRSLALELTGDIYLAQGKTEQAYAAYTSALDSSGDQTRPLLEIKRDNAAPSGGQFSVFAQPLEQALQDARKTLAADDASDSTSDD
jgi:predicted negative regulator of RcsB-dependent stress response